MRKKRVGEVEQVEGVEGEAKLSGDELVLIKKADAVCEFRFCSEIDAEDVALEAMDDTMVPTCLTEPVVREVGVRSVACVCVVRFSEQAPCVAPSVIVIVERG